MRQLFQKRTASLPKKGSSKMKWFANQGSNFFSFREDSFTEGDWCWRKQTGSDESFLPWRKWDNLLCVSSPFNIKKNADLNNIHRRNGSSTILAHTFIAKEYVLCFRRKSTGYKFLEIRITQWNKERRIGNFKFRGIFMCVTTRVVSEVTYFLSFIIMS